VDRVITRNVRTMDVGQVFYTPWCDEHGAVIDDGTVARLEEDRFRWTSADPSLRWITQNTTGLRVSVDEVSEATAALALQGPMAARVLRACADANVDALRYFRITARAHRWRAGGVSRTGYTGDLGYEIWIPSEHAVRVWDAVMTAGQPLRIEARRHAGAGTWRVPKPSLLLLDVDYIGKPQGADFPAQLYTPYEMGLSRLVSLDKGPFVGRAALVEERRRGPAGWSSVLENRVGDVEALDERVG
jgi:aminomethyltransferase